VNQHHWITDNTVVLVVEVDGGGVLVIDGDMAMPNAPFARERRTRNRNATTEAETLISATPDDHTFQSEWTQGSR